MTLWYMRDNHTFVELLPNVNLAMATLHEVFHAECGTYGMLAAKAGPGKHSFNKVVHAGKIWADFEPRARAYLEEVLRPAF